MMITIANGLHELGQHAITVLCADESGTLRRRLHKDIPVIKVGFDYRAVSWLDGIKRFADYLKRQKHLPDVIISSRIDLDVSIGLAKVDVRHIKSIRSFFTGLRFYEIFKHMRRLWQRVYTRMYATRPDKYAAISAGIKEELVRQGVPEGEISVVYDPIITERTNDLFVESVSHRWLNDKKKPVVISVGRLDIRQKAHDLLLRAFRRVREGLDARLMLIGDGDEHVVEKLRKLIKKYGLEGSVELTGEVRNPLPYISRSDLFVLSSRYEGFGHALVEAMYCRVPVVSTNCPHGPREVLSGGRYGTLVNVDDEHMLADAIVKGLMDGRDTELGDEMRKRAEEFNEADSIKNWAYLIDDILIKR